MKIGGNPGGTFFRGQMDEFRIFSRALSASELQSIMNTPIVQPATPTPGPTFTPTATPGPTSTPTATPVPTPTPTSTPTTTPATNANSGANPDSNANAYVSANIHSDGDAGSNANRDSSAATAESSYGDLVQRRGRNSATDNSGSGHNGTLVNGPSLDRWAVRQWHFVGWN